MVLDRTIPKSKQAVEIADTGLADAIAEGRERVRLAKLEFGDWLAPSTRSP